MYKLVALFAMLAVASAAPAPGIVVAPISVSHSSHVVSHGTVVHGPLVHTAPVVKVSVPVVHSVHSVPVVKVTPVVHSVPVIKVTPVVHSVHAVPVAHAVSHSSSVVHHGRPLVKVVHSAPVIAIHH